MRTENRRIALNVAVTYGRSLVSLACGLFTSRWVLQALGADDFGLYVVVGSLLAFAGFFGGLLCTSISRHFAYALGRNGEDEARAWFASAFVVHFVLALAVTVLVIPTGEVLIRHFITLPTERMSAALVVFRLSVVSFFVGTAGIPFGAYFTAHQRFVELALFGTLQTVVVFAGAYGLLTCGGDRLVAYAAVMCASSVFIQVLQAVWASWKWKLPSGFRCLASGGRERVRKILTFAGWNGLGGGGWLVASRGSDFVTNRFFGTAGNAAYGIAFQLQSQAEALANALVGALTPAVTERRGAGDLEGMRRLSLQSGFWGALLMAIFVVPLVAEMEAVLGLWLKTPPAGAGEACAILLAVSVCNKLTMGQQLAIAADGRIAAWQAVGGIFQVLALPLTVMLAMSGVGLRSAALAYALVFVGCFASNVYYGKRIAGIAVGGWLQQSVVPFLAMTSLAAGAALLPRLWMASGFGRVAVVSSLTSLAFAVGIGIWKRLT